MEKKICTFFMENKNRLCKFEVFKDSNFCHHHSQTEDFVVCPVHPTHSILKSKLKIHIKNCPKILFEEGIKNQLWYTDSINLPEKVEDDTIAIENQIQKGAKSKKKWLIDLQLNESEILKKLVCKIDLLFMKSIEIYNQSIPEIHKLICHEILPDLKTMREDCTDTEKDIIQIQKLIFLMKSYNLINENYIYVEFGAGRGNFSHYIALENNDKSSHILLEREPRRNKLDKNHKNNQNFKRFRTDILNFDMKTIPSLISTSTGIYIFLIIFPSLNIIEMIIIEALKNINKICYF